MAVWLAVALAAGGVLGLEREWKRKAAGLKTLSQVSMGAAVFAMLSLYLIDARSDGEPGDD